MWSVGIAILQEYTSETQPEFRLSFTTNGMTKLALNLCTGEKKWRVEARWLSLTAF
jgi:hypothetical protein